MSKRQKLNIVLMVSIAAAVMLVVVLSIVKFCSVFSGNPSEKVAQKQEGQVSIETPPVEETMATPATPRPKAVALTFDDGPSRANDPKIVETLQKYGAHATFFVLGDRARVDGDIMQMYLEADCEIGSHSWNHPQLSKLKWVKVKRQLDKTNKVVKKLTNGYEIQLLRPPYGSISKKMRKKLDMPMILWSLDTMDWKSRNSQKIFKKVKKKVKDGDIILMHNIYGSTAEAVEKIVPWLQEQGYDVLTVSELMERNDKKIENGKAYLHGRK
nr:polysaccharide deacetylase family protein [Eubacterium sp.]